MSRRKIAGMNQETLLIVGAVALVGIYFLTRTTAVPTQSGTLVTGPGGATYLPGNTTAQDINAGASGASSLINSLNNAGIFG